jgi:hypothetical protein
MRVTFEEGGYSSVYMRASSTWNAEPSCNGRDCSCAKVVSQG